MNVVICDDHQLFAEALATLLGQRGHRVVALTQDPSAAVESVREDDVDLCIMDLLFPDGSGVDGTREVRTASPPTKVVVLTAADEHRVLAAAVEAGACGVVAKGNDVSVLLDTIDRAGRGEAVLPIDLLDDAVSERHRAHDPVALQASFLSPREREVLRLLVDGCTTHGVAAGMGITGSTARTYIQNVLTKLGCHSRLEVVALAVRHGFARPSERSASLAPLDRPNASPGHRHVP